MLPFNTEAKLTQSKYGICIRAAVLLQRQKETIIHSIQSQMAIISIKEIPSQLNLKNKKLQEKFKVNCKKNTFRARFLFAFFSDWRIKKKLSPIKAYSIDHTGPNK
jgi:hypothetical protein